MGFRRPPRIDAFDYLGPHAYFLTICTFRRERWFVKPECADAGTRELLRTGLDYGFAILAYCFMPDHLHALVEGTRIDSDFVRLTAMFKQRSAFAHRCNHSSRLWQEGYFDRVIREEETCLGIAA
jgi:putative transposase